MKIYAASHLLPVSSPPIEGGAMAVEDGRIVAVGTRSEIAALHSGPVTEYPGCVIMPGLVNAHSHLELTHFPSWKIRKGIDYSPRTYIDWIIQVVKIRRTLTRRELEQSVLEGIRISLESGTTAVGEILSDTNLLPLYQCSRLGGRIYLEAIGQAPAHCEKILSAISESVAGSWEGGLRPGVSPHTAHTLSPALLSAVRELADRYSLPQAIHLAESRDELDFLFDSSGPIAEILYPFIDWKEYLPSPRRTTPAGYLDGLGLLRPGTTAVHCVHLSPAEVELLKTRGVAVVLCPRSNDKLDVGKAPARRLKKAGIPLALGTDSLASNDSLSLFDEARFLIQQFPEDFTHAEALRMATLSGASVIGVARDIGSLEKGKQADFLVVSLKEKHLGDLSAAIIEEGKILDVFVKGASLESVEGKDRPGSL
jgi:cytosine/adenosine deaminase-related metal-dependent hydrolase